MTTSVELITIIAITFIAAILAAILIFLLQDRRSRYYDEKSSRAIIEEMRGDFERQMYKLTERLMATEERWRDVNHLLLSSQSSQKIEERAGKKVYLSEFLKSAGITKEDLEIDRKLVFVLTPFNDRYRAAYDNIQQICNQIGIKCMRGDEQYTQGDILRHVLKGIVKANIVIANIDGRNPNVLYELGLVHAMDKGVILVSQTVVDLPVDIKSKRVIVYEEPSELQSKLKDELLKLLVSD
jgi:hypothetical protein